MSEEVWTLLVCPHCGNPLQYNLADAAEADEKWSCGKCGKHGPLREVTLVEVCPTCLNRRGERVVCEDEWHLGQPPLEIHHDPSAETP